MGKKYELGLEEAAHEAYKEQEQLEAQSREAIKAWCDDPSVEIEATSKNLIEWWNLKESKGIFTTLDCYYRIAKPRKWYRVGKRNDGFPILVWSDDDERFWNSHPHFKEWLDERKYYE